MRILVTRPAEQAQSLRERLAQAGHEAILAPLLEIEQVPHAALAKERGAPDLTIASSAQAFIHVSNDLLRSMELAKIAVVGARTAQAAAARGLEVAAIEADAAALAQRIVQLAPPCAKILYLAGVDRKPTLERDLRAAGFSLETIVVYAARAVASLPEPARRALAAGAVDVVTHFSRRSAALFATHVLAAGLADAARAPVHLCLSGDVAAGLAALQQEALQQDPRLRIVVAPEPTSAAMLAALQDLHLSHQDLR